MTVTQFRNEPDVSSFDPPAEDFPTFGEEQASAIIEDLLLGLYLRSNLTESDRVKVDLLTPPHSTLFLKVGAEHFGTLPDTDLAKRADRCGLDSEVGVIFTDQHRIGAEYGARQLQTCSLAWRDGSQLVVGLAEPNVYGQSETSASRFADLVDKFRTALKSVNTVAARLEPVFSGDQPALIVNRASGRVLAANRAISGLEGVETSDLIDREYSAIAKLLSQAAVSRGLKMKNISLAGYHLAIVQILPERRSTSADRTDQSASDFLMRSMKNKITSVTAAISHLDRLSNEPHPDCAELAEIVMNEALECDRHLERLYLLQKADRMEKSTVRPGREIEAAIVRLENNPGARIDFHSEKCDDLATIQAPAKAIELLVESALLAHLAKDDKNGVAELVAQSSTDEISIRIGPGPVTKPMPPSDSRWLDYVTRLSEALGYLCRVDTTSSHRPIIEIIIPREGVNLHHA